MRLALRRTAACLLLSACPAVFAAPFATPTAINTGSFARAHALPEVDLGAVQEEGESQWGLSLTAANEYYAKGDRLLVDAETLRLALGTRQSLAPDWEWGLTVPLLMQSGGALDSLIENWHSTFGLPNGGREQAPRDRYRVQYTRNGQTLLDLHESHNGFGDVQALLGWQASPQLSLRALLQIPTGQASTLSGGHAGVAVWGEWAAVLGAAQSTRIALAGGVSASQTRGPLQSIQRPVAGFGRAGLSTALFGSVQGNVSLQLHSALYENTGDRPISGPGGSASFGLGFLVDGYPVGLSVDEDVLLNSSPDLALRLSVGLSRI